MKSPASNETISPTTSYGEKTSIPARELVVGDIVSLEAGDFIPADGRLIELPSPIVSQTFPVFVGEVFVWPQQFPTFEQSYQFPFAQQWRRFVL